MSRSAPPGEGAWCGRLLAVPPPTVLFHATTPKKYGRMLATGHILPPVRGFTAEAGARTWAHEIDGHRPVILRLTLTGPAYPLPDHHNEDGWAFWSPAPARVQRLIRAVDERENEVDLYVEKSGLWMAGGFMREFRPESSCTSAFAYAPTEAGLFDLLTKAHLRVVDQPAFS